MPAASLSQALIDTGFRLSTGQVEALRPAGVRLLGSVLRVFAGVEDPLLPGECCCRAALMAAVSPGSIAVVCSDAAGDSTRHTSGCGQPRCLHPTHLCTACVKWLASIICRAAYPSCAGARLMEQYQAQLVSALRAALAPAAGPTLSIAGGALATAFLESGLAAGGWLRTLTLTTPHSFASVHPGYSSETPPAPARHLHCT
jgi:hypothetical protein